MVGPSLRKSSRLDPAKRRLKLVGGYTKTGTAEAVLSNSGTFNHNNDWNTFVSLFGGTTNIQKLK